MKVLRRRRGIYNVPIDVFGGIAHIKSIIRALIAYVMNREGTYLEKALNATTAVLGTCSVVSVRQEHYETALA